ncbi:hypothetical protein [Nonlabens ponticola]|uniref:Uncharacterized protein n=1 Tax=Nonlabens ponticola TaxID=2496866 RepID=A0A3S9MXE6_9FLAO|nr:hypothetical protein [Nonlabens ponticola]AZQ43946.1 hypothetical protein EJ995_06755 [Nonlabens ponticola]
MKKFSIILFIYFFGSIMSCCSNGGTITTITIESVYSELYFYEEPEEDGRRINPEIEELLAIIIDADSVSQEVDIVANFSNMDTAMACDDGDSFRVTNLIDSVQVFTIYDFDQNHPAGTSVNDILQKFGNPENVAGLQIIDLEDDFYRFKFLSQPQNDSIQFLIRCRITERGRTETNTQLIITE